MEGTFGPELRDRLLNLLEQNILAGNEYMLLRAQQRLVLILNEEETEEEEVGEENVLLAIHEVNVDHNSDLLNTIYHSFA